MGKKRIDLSTITTYQAGIMQATMHRKLQRFSDEVLQPFGITKMQWLIVGTVLDHHPNGIRVTELARILATNMSYMTNTVNLLESRDILTRSTHKSDSRSRMVRVHDDFLPQCQKIEKRLRERLRTKVYSKVDQADFQAYMRVVAALSETDK